MSIRWETTDDGDKAVLGIVAAVLEDRIEDATVLAESLPFEELIACFAYHTAGIYTAMQVRGLVEEHGGSMAVEEVYDSEPELALRAAETVRSLALTTARDIDGEPSTGDGTDE